MFASHMILPDLRNQSIFDRLSPTLLSDLGLIHKGAAGRFSLLPLGTLIFERMKKIHRRNMLAAGAIEATFLSLAPADTWRESGRWDSFGPALIKTKLHGDQAACLNPTHEEAAVTIMRDWLTSYRDLPKNLFCIQKVYRDEPRPKSQLLRTHEFVMADSYSFHQDSSDADTCYQKMQDVFSTTFAAYGLPCQIIHADNGLIGGSRSVEFQLPHELGESRFVACSCGYAADVSVLRKEGICNECGEEIEAIKGIELGHIFHLETTYSAKMSLRVRGQNNKMQHPVMGCTGIGMTRSLQSIVMSHLKESGVAWPKAVAPFDVVIQSDSNEKSQMIGIEANLAAKGVSVLADDRDVSKAAQNALTDFTSPPIVLKQVGAHWDAVAKGNSVETGISAEAVLPYVDAILLAGQKSQQKQTFAERLEPFDGAAE
ncbi:MAG: aminoacyl--tRNA ligase-related protein [Litoreibacter sp.]|uniref:proline--tRNA ligase n=1 Tax=Litoreibacter sp. TaxID=1969459 RepID=UPI003298D17D